MKTRISIIFILFISLSSCSSKIDYSNLYGIWIPAITANNGMDISEQIVFDENRIYSARSSFDDTLVYKVEGRFTLDKSNSSIDIKFTDISKNDVQIETITDSTYSIGIIELTESKLTLKSKNHTLKYIKKL